MIVVEHDPDVIQTADHIIDIGPNAGKDGERLCLKEVIKTFSHLRRAQVKL